MRAGLVGGDAVGKSQEHCGYQNLVSCVDSGRMLWGKFEMTRRDTSTTDSLVLVLVNEMIDGILQEGS